MDEKQDDHLASRLNDLWKNTLERRVKEELDDQKDPRDKYPFNEGKTSDGDLLDFLFTKMQQGVITRNDYNELFSAFAKLGRAAGLPNAEDDEEIFDLAVPRHQAKVLRDIVMVKHPQIRYEFEELYRKYERLTRNESHLE